MDRRTALTTGALIAAAAIPQVASADGAVSAATVNRARMVYGGRIADLKDAVGKGDFAAIASERNAFVLFNSGAYANLKDKPLKKKAVAQTNAIFAAMRSNDKGAVKAAYDAYVADNEIRPLPSVDTQKGQGYSSDFDYRVKTKAGAVYVR
jgi:Photosystem II Psb31 protein